MEKRFLTVALKACNECDFAAFVIAVIASTSGPEYFIATLPVTMADTSWDELLRTLHKIIYFKQSIAEDF